MPTDARLALLIAGIVLLAIALIGAAVAAARKNSRRSGHVGRAVIAVVGAALIVWVAIHRPRAAREQQAPVAAAAPSTPAAPTAPAGPAAGSPAAGPAHPDLVFLADSVFDGCVTPTKPADVPDGATATQAQMQASQVTTRAFDTATDAYLSCLNTAANDFVRQYGRGMTQTNLQAIDTLHTKINNSAVDVDQSVANRFNQQLRIFKARTRP